MNLIPPLADEIFYPSDPTALTNLIDPLLEKAGLPGPGELPLGIVTPHGAYEFTGELMARAYGRVRHLKPAWILLAAPVHLDQEPGFILPREDGFYTPLGEVPIHREGRDILKEEPGFSVSPEPYKEEPALELQLPFLYRLFPGVPVLPLYAAGRGRKWEKALARGLGKMERPPLTVITSNLSPYEIPRLSEAKARQFLDAVGGSDFDPRTYPQELYRPCGLPLMAGIWEFWGGAVRMDLIDWACDRPQREENQKCAFYGAFTLNAPG